MSTLYLRSKASFLLAVFIISNLLVMFGLVGNVFAQEPTSNQEVTSDTPVAATELSVLADVNIVGGGIKENKPRQVDIGFTLENMIGIQEGVRYGVELISGSDESKIIDTQVDDSVLTLKAGEYTYRVISYIPPASVPAGTYTVKVSVWTDKGLPLAFKTFGEVTLAEPQVENPVVIKCDTETPSVDGMVDCVLTNKSETEKNIELQAAFFTENPFGENKSGYYLYNLVLKPEGDTTQTLKVPEGYLDELMALGVSIKESGTLLFRNYSTNGVSKSKVKISNVYTETAEAEYRFGITVENYRKAETILISPTNSLETCMEKVVPVSSMLTEVLLPKTCQGEIMITLHDKDKNLLDSDSVILPSQVTTSEEVAVANSDDDSQKMILILVTALGLILLALFIFLVKNKKAVPIAMLFILGGVAFGAGEAEALTTSADKDYQCVNQTDPRGCNRTTDFYTVSATFTGPSTVQAGEVYEVSAAIDATKADGLSFPGDMSAASTCPPGNGAGSGCAANDLSRNLTNFSSVQATELDTVNIGTRSFTVPANTSAGIYKVGFWAYLTDIPTGSTGYASTMSYGSMDFTVTAAAQCGDGIDNDSDGLSDTNDPGCHSDCNASNNTSYVSSDTTENTSCTPTVTLTPRLISQ